jgi:hypothetical protein
MYVVAVIRVTANLATKLVTKEVSCRAARWYFFYSQTLNFGIFWNALEWIFFYFMI